MNLVLSLPAFVCLILLFLQVLNSRNMGEDFFIVLLVLSGLFMITLNGFLNIYILQRFFPDKLLPGSIRQLNVFSLILNILASIGILIFCIYIYSIVFSRYNEGRDISGKWAWITIFILWIVQVAVLIMQGQLPRLINRNHNKKINSLIDSIGQ
ncbi:MAG TPA: hypothetical protein VI461_05130 [Chitinophagaceae bacterium]|nr:hypothetical protein [Chitinophagaceae bacterium]